MRIPLSNEIATTDKVTSQKLTLADIGVGQSCIITQCHLPPKLKARFAEMGLVSDTEVAVIRIAPLGDPIVIRARGYELCIRKDTAKCFDVKPC